ncbi:dihydrofolate reductase [Microterricola gilva]|uniref:Dihydrofolate reductase n=1 Tax=Microterricola gilva TaxID=393267 RepID=A0A4Q8AKE0_9MICO|nr:dihydrofolate reductase family protein [Microterricola gilva]RZU64977.1 dihydrofolate reductase [Microterricola gilva]
MTKTVYYVACSLDGFIADRENSLDWLMEFGFEEFSEQYASFIADIGAVIMGADTYDFIVNDPSGWSYAMPAWVLSHRSLPGIEGADIRFTSADGPGGIAALHAAAALAAGEKKVWVIGGGNVASQFADAGLLDELQVTIMPVLLGAGRPLLPLARNTRLTALGRTPYAGGAIELRYAVNTPDVSEAVTRP